MGLAYMKTGREEYMALFKEALSNQELNTSESQMILSQNLCPKLTQVREKGGGGRGVRRGRIAGFMTETWKSLTACLPKHQL